MGFSTPIATTRPTTRSGSGTFDITAVATFLGGSTWFTNWASFFNLDVYAGSPTPWAPSSTSALVSIGAGVEITPGTGVLTTWGSVGFGNLVGSSWISTGTPGPTPGAGTWNYSFDAEEVTWYQLDSAGMAPIFAGETALPRLILYASVRPKVGGSYSVTLSVGGSSLSVSGTITSAMAALIVANPLSVNDSGFNASLKTGFRYFDNGASYTMPWAGTIDGVALGRAYSYDAGTSGTLGFDYKYDFTSGLAITASSPSFADFGPYDPSVPGGNDLPAAALVQWPGTGYTLKGSVITAPPGTEPSIVKGNILYPIGTLGSQGGLSFAPTDSVSVSLGAAVQTSAPFDPGGSFAGPNEDHYPGVQAGLDSSDTTTAAECNGDYRLPIRLPSVDGPSLSLASRITLDPCNSLTTPGAWAGVTLVGGALQCDTSTTTTAAATYATPVISRQGRYLAIKINAPAAGVPIQVRITTAKRTITFNAVTAAAGSYADVVVDLCAPNGIVPSDKQFSKFTYPPTVDDEGPMWGANLMAGVSIKFPRGIGLCLIGEIAIVVSASPLISTMHANVGYQRELDSPTVFNVLGTIVDVDGRRALEQPGALITGGSIGLFKQLSDLAAGLDPGWTYAYVAPTSWNQPPTPWLAYLGGGGAVASGSTVTLSIWVRHAWSMGTPIPMQTMVDAVAGYPGMGGLLTGGAIDGTACILPVCKILRGTFSGIVLDWTGLPLAGVEVQSKEGAAVTGTYLSTDSEGRYWLGTPGSLYGGDTITAQLDSDPTKWIAVTEAVNVREDRRLCFRHAAPPARSIGYDISAGARHARAYGKVSTGTFWIGTAQNKLPITFTDTDSAALATWARPRWAKQGAVSWIGVFYGDGLNCFWARTNDEGQTWEDLTTMATGSVGDYEESATGIKWFYKVDTPDSGVTWNIYRKILDSKLNVLSNWTITNLTGIDDAPIAVREGLDEHGGWRMGIQFFLAGALTNQYAPDGLTFV